MKHFLIPAIVLCAACATTPSTPRSTEGRNRGPANCTPGCCDDQPDCCVTTAAPVAARAEAGACCTPASDCCAVADATAR